MSKNYLLIGCTGSLGQAIVYRLLKNTEHTLYIAIREKKDNTGKVMSIEERMRALCETIHLDYSNYSKRIYLIECTYDTNRNIQISDADKKRIKEEIHVFLNALADINFNRELKKATQNNVTTALNWMDLYNDCSGVEQYTYVSTAFTGFHRASSDITKDIIPEEFHIEETCGHTFEKCEQTYSDILNGKRGDTELEKSVFENSYTYTKNLTELLLSQRIKNGSFYILRPSIIVSAVSQPYRGWGKFQTFNTFMLGAITGRCLYYCMDYEKYKLNTVPVDMVAEDSIRIIKEKQSIVHSCLTHNSKEWNRDDTYILTQVFDNIYHTYSKNPITYKEKTYYPSHVHVYRSKMSFFTWFIFIIIHQFYLNMSRYPFVRAVQETMKQIIFTYKYNKLFSAFSNKNCCFQRTGVEIPLCYTSISHKEIVNEFIHNIPELLNHETISWLCD